MKEREEFFENEKENLKGVNLNKVFYLVEKAIKTNKPEILEYKNIVSLGQKTNMSNLKKMI